MAEAKHLAHSLVSLLADPRIGWFTPTITAIEDLTAEQAARVPAEGFNCVWSVINHMNYWQEYLLLGLRGEKTDRLKQEGKDNWQEPRPPYQDHTWQADRERLFAVNKELAEVVISFSDQALGEPYAPDKAERFVVIQGIIAHNCYHTNEIISIRHMLGYWLKKT